MDLLGGGGLSRDVGVCGVGIGGGSGIGDGPLCGGFEGAGVCRLGRLRSSRGWRCVGEWRCIHCGGSQIGRRCGVSITLPIVWDKGLGL